MSGQILHQTLLLVDCGNSALKYQRLEIPLQADDEPGIGAEAGALQGLGGLLGVAQSGVDVL